MFDFLKKLFGQPEVAMKPQPVAIMPSATEKVMRCKERIKRVEQQLERGVPAERKQEYVDELARLRATLVLSGIKED
jgi:hypothetical protein